MKIRKATKEDIGQMLKIIKLNSPNYPPDHAKKEMEDMFSKSLHRPTYLVIEKNEEIVAFGGFIRSCMDEVIFDILWVNTNPKYMRKGFGKMLVEGLIKQIKDITEKPLPKLVMLSTKVPKFYEGLGFKQISPDYDPGYILMEKRL